jgi:hypothetical protein
VSRLARFLSVIGLLSAILTISLTHFAFPRISLEAMIVISAVSIFMALACSGLALLLISFVLLRKAEPAPIATAIITLVTLTLSGAWLLVNY